MLSANCRGGRLPFCTRMADAGVPTRESAAAVALPDAFPVSDGYTLVMPRRHIERIEHLAADEWWDLFALVREICREIAVRPGG